MTEVSKVEVFNAWTQFCLRPEPNAVVALRSEVESFLVSFFKERHVSISQALLNSVFLETCDSCESFIHELFSQTGLDIDEIERVLLGTHPHRHEIRFCKETVLTAVLNTRNESLFAQPHPPPVFISPVPTSGISPLSTSRTIRHSITPTFVPLHKLQKPRHAFSDSLARTQMSHFHSQSTPILPTLSSSSSQLPETMRESRKSTNAGNSSTSSDSISSSDKIGRSASVRYSHSQFPAYIPLSSSNTSLASTSTLSSQNSHSSSSQHADQIYHSQSSNETASSSHTNGYSNGTNSNGINNSNGMNGMNGSNGKSSHAHSQSIMIAPKSSTMSNVNHSRNLHSRIVSSSDSLNSTTTPSKRRKSPSLMTSPTLSSSPSSLFSSGSFSSISTTSQTTTTSNSPTSYSGILYPSTIRHIPSNFHLTTNSSSSTLKSHSPSNSTLKSHSPTPSTTNLPIQASNSSTLLVTSSATNGAPLNSGGSTSNIHINGSGSSREIISSSSPSTSHSTLNLFGSKGLCNKLLTVGFCNPRTCVFSHPHELCMCFRINIQPVCDVVDCDFQHPNRVSREVWLSNIRVQQNISDADWPEIVSSSVFYCSLVSKVKPCGAGKHCDIINCPKQHKKSLKQGTIFKPPGISGFIQKQTLVANTTRIYVLKDVTDDPSHNNRVQGFMRNGKPLEISRLEQIKNSTLHALYLNRFEELRIMNRQVPQEIYAFHGSSEESIVAISKDGFDLTKVQRTLHGFGVYCAQDPSISKSYCRGGNVMLVVKLLVDDLLWVAEQKYYVVQRSDAALPLYVLTFKRKKGDQT